MAKPLLSSSGGAQELVETLYDYTLGTIFGNMTDQVATTEAFDGDLEKINPECVSDQGVTDSFLGLALDQGYAITKVTIWASSDVGYTGLGDPTWKLFGKNGEPANATDGTELGTTGNFSDANSDTRTITSSDQVTPYTHVWVAEVSGSANKYLAQAAFYVMA